MRRWLRQLPPATFLHQMGVASVVAGVILLGMAALRKRVRA